MPSVFIKIGSLRAFQATDLSVNNDPLLHFVRESGPSRVIVFAFQRCVGHWRVLSVVPVLHRAGTGLLAGQQLIDRPVDFNDPVVLAAKNCDNPSHQKRRRMFVDAVGPFENRLHTAC